MSEPPQTGSDKVLKALDWQPKKKASQAAFDEAVQDSMDALGLEAEEAVESAIEEFKLKNADMTDVIMTPDGANIAQHAVTLAVEELQAASPAAENNTDFDSAVSCLSRLLAADDPAARQENLAVSVQGGALRPLLLVLASDSLSAPQVISVVSLISEAMQNVSNRDAFAEETVLQGVACHGPDVVTSVLDRHSLDSAVVEAVGRLCALAVLECEESKCKLMESGFPATSLAMISQASVALPAAVALLDALKGCMTHDDLRPPASKAFMHARVLALDKKAVPVFLAVLHRAEDFPESLHGVISSLQQLCANDEICIQVCQANGVHLVMDAMQKHFEHADMVASTCGMLRQLAKSDNVKVLLVSIDGLDTISSVLEHHKQSPKVCTQALGLLATLLLRQPEHCEAAFANEALMSQVVDAMLAHRSSPPVMRQACQLVRNLVVRNPDLRKPMLGKGVERVLRGAKTLRECDDVALAALRDLGLDDYNA